MRGFLSICVKINSVNFKEFYKSLLSIWGHCLSTYLLCVPPVLYSGYCLLKISLATTAFSVAACKDCDMLSNTINYVELSHL